MQLIRVLFTPTKRKYTKRMPKGWITISKAAELLGIEPQQIRDMIRADLIPEDAREKVGRAWLIKEDVAMRLHPRKKGRPFGSVTKR